MYTTTSYWVPQTVPEVQNNNKTPEIPGLDSSLESSMLYPSADVLTNREDLQPYIRSDNSCDESGYFQKAPVPYLVFNAIGHVIEANEASISFLGRTLNELLHYRFDLLMQEGDQEIFKQHLKSVYKIRTRQECEVEIRHTDGSYRQISIVSSPLIKKGRFMLRSVLIDISKHKLLEADLTVERERALQAARFTNELLANVSHELRTPLSGVIGFAEILENDLPEDQSEFAQLIVKSGHRLLRSVNAVLDFARIQAQYSKAMLQTVDVAAAVFDQCLLLEPLASRKGIEFTINVPEKSLNAELDPAFLDRIIDNLVGNAIKYTDRGTVEINIESRRNEVVIEVKDTGIGITPEFIPFIYQPFRQEKMGDNRPYDGVGLGLSITKRLIDLMKGNIDVQSERGVGSTFTVRFAASESFSAWNKVKPSEAATSAVNTPLLSECKLLVVEDNPETQVLVEKFLEGICKPVITSTYDEAIQVFKARPFDVALLDINLGDYRTGKDLLLDLRSLPAGDSIYAVAFTAYALPSDQAGLMACGFDDYVSKPFTRNDLTAMLQRACKHLHQKTNI